MCDLLNRIWSRPRGEWNRVVRNELPDLADKLVAELQRGFPALSALLGDTPVEEAQWALEQALLTVLGYQKESESKPGAVPSVVTPMPVARARQDLFDVLAGQREMPEEGLTELSRAAGWPIPDTLQAVVLATPAEAAQLAAALGHALIGSVDGYTCLFVPDPATQTRARLEAALKGRPAAVGHVVPATDTASSLRWARYLLTLAPGRVGPESRPAFVDDHLSALLLLQDESLADALTSRWLGPLEELTPRQSERLEVTLLAWLEGGGAPEAAKLLHVHPQTVRYRLRQIEKLFGPVLRDPRTRFELEMALRSRRLMAHVRSYRARAGRRARAVASSIRPLGMAREARVNGL
ncbi:PucR C-terminal helix-turn-helix domain-containing protein [Streptomyces sp. 2224.1]|nr:PucR-like helix-turn-helix protein [Streptomyces sp. 2321.6]SDR48528.1 PucR C-terminal helix-turn-helix domain-containing protein [Streptomyces sp. KS_16]SEC40198.1 PucR C-terminal helix-turn-helix domain-containing protein [Streptomyces sp. 2224.1]SEC64806.1 PucR C-terminal helix-turn-helix domain-containing protein [Streptomyces sp. 2133.1]SEE95062.1 PucR C-terminal helix-turn-helix domain-containing protein [Streptomyces sp. 2112.3]SNC68686.1 PucR C-terminal helix-turn-helix domain-conta